MRRTLPKRPFEEVLVYDVDILLTGIILGDIATETLKYPWSRVTR